MVADRSILKEMQGKREKPALPNSVLRKQGNAGRKTPVRVVSHDLLVLEPESRGYDPYDNPPPPPASEFESEATINRRALRKPSKNG